MSAREPQRMNWVFNIFLAVLIGAIGGRLAWVNADYQCRPDNQYRTWLEEQSVCDPELHQDPHYDYSQDACYEIVWPDEHELLACHAFKRLSSVALQ